MTIAELIEREGGPTAFARKTGCPQRTAESWASDADSGRKPAGWLVPVLDFYCKHKSGRRSK